MKYYPAILAAFGSSLFAAAIVAPAATVRAAAVTLVNAGFESQAVADGVHSTNIPGWNIVTGNTLVTDAVSTYNPINSNYTGATAGAPPAPAGGTNVLDLTASGLVSATGIVTQQTNVSLTGDTTYTLTVAVGNPLSDDLYHGYTISLTAGVTVLNFVTANTTPDGTFQDVTLTYTPNLLDPVVASLITQQQKLTISLASGALNVATLLGTSTVNFDNVRLDASPAAVPEPSTVQAVLAGLAALGCAGYARRRRQLPL